MATSTFYPDAGTGSTTVDGSLREFQATGVSWASIIGGAGTDVNTASAISNVISWGADTTTDTWNYVRRSHYGFDTSSLTGQIVNSATLSIYGTGKTDTGSFTPDINIYSSTPATNNTLVAGDFDGMGTTAFSSAIAYSSWSTTGYNDFGLNNDGIAAIDIAGVSNFGARNATNDVGASSPTWSNSAFTDLSGYYADQTGTSQDPKLVVNHVSGAIKPPAATIGSNNLFIY